MHRLFFCLVCFVLPRLALASQIVAMDVAPSGGVKAALAEAVTPVLHSELSRVRGISVITEADVRALARLDASKAALDCEAESCIAAIAGALGAELLLTAQLSRVGKSYHLSLTLLEVEGAKVLRRVTGKASGNEEAASEAIQSAVRQLFAGELPAAAQGPGSLSMRAFKAALAGLRANTLDPKVKEKASRKRVVLDLVRTELDFDAEPKLTELKYEIARGIRDFEERLAMASSPKQVHHLVGCIALYQELAKDRERVKEIRTRARARGAVPSSRPLRFESAEVPERKRDEVSKRYERAYKDASKTVRSALKAWAKQRRAAFAKTWTPDRRRTALSRYDSERGKEADQGVEWSLLPLYALTPSDFRHLAKRLERDKTLVVMRLGTKGKKTKDFHDTDRIYLKTVNGRWLLKDW